MDIITLIIEALPSIGFPILCCILLGGFIYIIYKDSKVREEKLYNQLQQQNDINGRFAEIIAQYEIKIEEIRTDVKEIKIDIIEIKAK